MKKKLNQKGFYKDNVFKPKQESKAAHLSHGMLYSARTGTQQELSSSVLPSLGSVLTINIGLNKTLTV